jgi:ABC-type transport system involved in multi-copper enzyme maturation permease subunit
MNVSRLWTITTLELTQRMRSVAWYVLLGVFAVILLIVTALSFLAFSWWGAFGAGGAIYSAIVYVVLLLVLLVSPTIAGNAVNGDRDAATLAAVQVTLATTGEIVVGKLLAAWITGLAFVAVAVPFLAVAMIAGGVSPVALLVSLVVLVVEILVFAAIGVGLSALLARPLFSVASTYLVMAAFTIGTLIVFGLGGAAVRTEVTSHSRWTDTIDGETYTCSEWETYTSDVPRFDRVWWVLAANPFVVIADATPTAYDRNGYPSDLFGQIASGVRYAQIAPEEETWSDYCDESAYSESASTRDATAGLLPSWIVGLGVQILVAGGLFWGGWVRTRTPARALPPGTRVA